MKGSELVEHAMSYVQTLIENTEPVDVADVCDLNMDDAEEVAHAVNLHVEPEWTGF